MNILPNPKLISDFERIVTGDVIHLEGFYFDKKDNFFIIEKNNKVFGVLNSLDMLDVNFPYLKKNRTKVLFFFKRSEGRFSIMQLNEMNLYDEKMLKKFKTYFLSNEHILVNKEKVSFIIKKCKADDNGCLFMETNESLRVFIPSLKIQLFFSGGAVKYSEIDIDSIIILEDAL